MDERNCGVCDECAAGNYTQCKTYPKPSDLVKRLRILDRDDWSGSLLDEAADEIERLQKEIRDIRMMDDRALATWQKERTKLQEQLATVTQEQNAQKKEWSKAYDIAMLAKHELQACQKECSALRSDAERYRWLREQVSHQAFIPIAQCVWKRNSDPHGEWVNLINAEDMDAHIDAARLSTDADLKEQTT